MDRTQRLAVVTLLAAASALGVFACTRRPAATPSATVAAREKFAQAVGAGRATLDRNRASRAAIVRGLGFEDDPSGPCLLADPPVSESDIDEHKSLFVHDRETLDAADFSLHLTLDTLAQEANAAGATGTTAEGMYLELWDTQNTTADAVGPGIHCDANGGTMNGFPVSCRKNEGDLAKAAATEVADYKAIALVNRLDLAGQGWRSCGEHRIVYARQSGGENLIIFEAVLPNPKPGCRSACRPVAEFWRSLSAMASATDRANALHEFYYTGLPGFERVVRISHYTAEGASSGYGSSGSGQIRTNSVVESPWMLKEFRLALNCTSTPCDLAVVPTMVKVNPFGLLWKEETGTAGPFQTKATDFQGQVVNEIGALAVKASAACPSSPPDINKIGYQVGLDFDAAQSDEENSGEPDNYRVSFDVGGPSTPGLFRHIVKTSGDLCSLSADQALNRATAQSCAGCHMPSTFGLTAPGSIGPTTLPDGTPTDSWPDSAGFVHTRSQANGAGIHELSPALETAFLPARRKFLVEVLNQDECPCKRKFNGLADALRNKGVLIEKAAFVKFAPQLRRENEQLGALLKSGRPVPPRALDQMRRRVADIEQKRDREIAAELQSAGVDVPPLGTNPLPQAIRLEPSKTGGDRRKEAALLEEAVLAILKSEPPRETVTGSFRVH